MSLENILLAMLRNPATGYDLKASFDEGAKYFWSAELSQIYPTLQRMEKAGLLSSQSAPSAAGPPRRVYRRTAKGTKTLRGWLRSGPDLETQRIPYIAQLIHMGELDDLKQTREFLSRLREQLQEFCAVLKAAEKSFASPESQLNATEFHEWLCVKMGLNVATARLRACDAALRATNQRISQGDNAHVVNS